MTGHRPAGGAGAGGGRLTHVDDQGRARMVDVTGKAITARRAEARCVVRARPEAVRALRDAPEEPLGLARAAGMQAAKQTSQLVPLCHPLPIDGIEVRVAPGTDAVEILATTSVLDRTGVEMEALTACGVAALSIVMALLPADPEARIDDLTLWHKSGGRSGTWVRTASGEVTHAESGT